MEQTKTTILASIAVVAILATASPGAETEQFQGTWVVVSAQLDGKSAESSKGDKFTFTGDKVTIETKVKKTAPAPFKIDAITSPKQIDIEDKTPQKGIYQIDGDRLKLCYGEKRPKASDPTAGLSRVLERRKPCRTVALTMPCELARRFEPPRCGRASRANHRA